MCRCRNKFGKLFYTQKTVFTDAKNFRLLSHEYYTRARLKDTFRTCFFLMYFNKDVSNLKNPQNEFIYI